MQFVEIRAFVDSKAELFSLGGMWKTDHLIFQPACFGII